jgi:hypothetical protein
VACVEAEHEQEHHRGGEELDPEERLEALGARDRIRVDPEPDRGEVDPGRDAALPERERGGGPGGRRGSGQPEDGDAAAAQPVASADAAVRRAGAA